MKKRMILLSGFCLSLLYTQAQVVLTPDSAVRQALRANGNIRAKQYEVLAQKQQIKQAAEINPTQISWQHGQYNSYVKTDNNFTVSQTLPFPFTMIAKKQAYEAAYGESGASLKLAEDELAYSVRNACAKLLYLQEKQTLYARQDSLFKALESAAALRYKSGEGSYLNWQQAKAKRADIAIQLAQLDQEIKNEKATLKAVLRMDDAFELIWEEAIIPAMGEFSSTQNGSIQVMQAQVFRAESEVRLEKSHFWPGLQFSYFNQSLIGGPTGSDFSAPIAVPSDRFQGFGIGLSIPLWAGPQMARVKSAKLQQEAAYHTLNQQETELKTEWTNLINTFMVAKGNLNSFEQESVPLAYELQKQALMANQQGDISAMEYLYQINDALLLLDRQIQLNYQTRILSNHILLLNGTH